MRALLPLLFTALMSAGADTQDVAEWQRRAVKKHPDLGKPGSEFNRIFLDRLRVAKASDPAFLARSDWPMRLADEIAKDQSALASAAAAAIPRSEPVNGKVLSKAEGGLLIRSGSRVVLLRSHPKEAYLVDDDHVHVMAQHAGIYEYTTALGAKATVRAYSYTGEPERR